jgi:hypothetical protein
MDPLPGTSRWGGGASPLAVIASPEFLMPVALFLAYSLRSVASCLHRACVAVLVDGVPGESFNTVGKRITIRRRAIALTQACRRDPLSPTEGA